MFDQLVNLIHLLAAMIWVGGSIFIKIVLEPYAKVMDPPEAAKLNSTIGKKFSMVAWISILLLLITGYIKTPEGMYFETSSEAGIALAIKHVLVLIVVVVGLLIGLVAVPRMRKAAPAKGAAPSGDFIKAQQQIRRLSVVTTILGVGIIVCAAFLW